MEDELAVLRTIYDIDFSISNTFPARYGIVVSADPDTETSDWGISNAWSSDASQLQVLFEPPTEYPANPVKVRVASLFAPPTVSEQLDSLEQLLNERACCLAEFEEIAMYEVAETARAWLWEQAEQANFREERRWGGVIVNEALDWDMQSISPSSIVTHQLKTERKVMFMIREECSIDITVAQARKSLRNSLWDVREAVDSIKKDLKKFQEQVHTCDSDEVESYTCGICFDELESDGHCVVFTPCHHVACIDCFTQYITIKITEKQVWNMTCPADAKCRVLVDPITIGWLLSKDLSEKYSFWFRQSFIDLQQKPDSKRRYFWCPNRHCQNAISVKVAGKSKVVTPTNTPQVLHCAGCSVTRCAECEYPGGHWPATCEEVKAYQAMSGQVNINPPKSLDEEETATKRCPKCSIMITKNGGCPHMHCTSCGFDFCWQCGTYWYDPQHSSVYPFKCTGEDREGKMAPIIFDNFTWDDSSDDWPAQFKRRVLSHEALFKREMSGRVVNSTNGSSSKTDPQLEYDISELLIEIHYILKNVFVFLFTRHKKRSTAVKRIFEISNRFEVQLTTLETLRATSLRVGKDRRNSSLSVTATQMKPELLYHEIRRERAQLVANIKLLAIAMANKERI